MKSWKRALGVFGALGALAGGSSAGAAALLLTPPLVSPGVGSSLSLDLMVAGTGAGAAPSVGGFDATVLFDPAVLTFSGVTYGSLLGAAPVEATTGTVSGPGSVSLAEVSFLAPGVLDALQPDGFLLATLGFVVVMEGSSTVSIISALLADGFGRSMSLEEPFGSVTITPPTQTEAVPEPGAFLLYALGVLVVAGSRAAHRRLASDRDCIG